MREIKASSKTEYFLRLMFLGHYRPAERPRDALKLIGWYGVAGIATWNCWKLLQDQLGNEGFFPSGYDPALGYESQVQD